MSLPVSYNNYQVPQPQFGAGSGGVSSTYLTVNDAYTTTPGGPYPDVTLTGQPLVQPGARVKIFSSYPNGWPIVLAYVRYNPTANVSLTASNVPGLVYYKDTTLTVVTGTFSESLGATVLGSEAGALLNPGVANGNWTYIQTQGMCPLFNVPASCVFGDGLQGGSATAFVSVRVAAATLATGWVAGIFAQVWTTRTTGSAPNTSTVYLNPFNGGAL